MSFASRFPLLDHISSGILAIDRDGTIRLWNSVLEAWSSKSSEEMQGQNLFSSFPHLDNSAFRSMLDNVFDGHETALLLSEELMIIPCPLPDGELRAQKVSISLIDEFQMLLFSIEDQSEQRKLVNSYREMADKLQSELDQKIALEHQNSRLISAIDQAAEAVLIITNDGSIDYANRAFCDQTGWRDHDIATLKLSSLFIELENRFDSVIRHVFAEGNTWQGRQNIRRRDGHQFTASISIAPISDEQGVITHAVIIQEDVSQQMVVDEKLRRSQKQEALITLVGGISHDFNNLLAGLVGQAYLATREVKDMPQTLSRLQKIQAITQEASAIVKQLLTFARQGDHQAKEFPLDAFIKEFSKLARHSVPESIRWSLDFRAGDYPFRGDANLLQQSLLNIIQNAVEACGDDHQGSIELILEHLNSSENQPLLTRYPVLRHGNFAHIKIIDNGRGIPEENREKIFDPFFTTKQLGSGLGLAIVMGCIRNHHGFIDVESTPGKGTTFHLLLPLKVKQPSAHSMPVRDTVHANILLVDDDPNVLEPTKELLECMGHSVTLASDGIEAYEVFKASTAGWDIVITDMVMPRMNGLESVKKIRQLDASVPVIFATGYDQALVIEGTRSISNSLLISKPFNPDDLEQLIIEMVKKSRA